MQGDVYDRTRPQSDGNDQSTIMKAMIDMPHPSLQARRQIQTHK